MAKNLPKRGELIFQAYLNTLAYVFEYDDNGVSHNQPANIHPFAVLTYQLVNPAPVRLFNSFGKAHLPAAARRLAALANRQQRRQNRPQNHAAVTTAAQATATEPFVTSMAQLMTINTTVPPPTRTPTSVPPLRTPKKKTPPLPNTAYIDPSDLLSTPPLLEPFQTTTPTSTAPGSTYISTNAQGESSTSGTLSDPRLQRRPVPNPSNEAVRLETAQQHEAHIASTSYVAYVIEKKSFFLIKLRKIRFNFLK